VCLEHVDVGVFCGGLGTRLNHPDLPKALVPVRGKPFLEHLLQDLEEAGARKVVLIAGHRGAQIGAFLDGYTTNLSVELVIYEPRGVFDALCQSLPLFTSDYVLLTNGDTLLSSDICRFVNSGKTRKASVLWTRNVHTSYMDDSGFRLFKSKTLLEVADFGDYELFVRSLAYPIMMPGHFLDLGTPERLALANDYQ
jgi:NDP-sugar pyrophosphorylase family protein